MVGRRRLSFWEGTGADKELAGYRRRLSRSTGAMAWLNLGRGFRLCVPVVLRAPLLPTDKNRSTMLTFQAKMVVGGALAALAALAGEMPGWASVKERPIGVPGDRGGTFHGQPPILATASNRQACLRHHACPGRLWGCGLRVEAGALAGQATELHRQLRVSCRSYSGSSTDLIKPLSRGVAWVPSPSQCRDRDRFVSERGHNDHRIPTG